MNTHEPQNFTFLTMVNKLLFRCFSLSNQRCCLIPTVISRKLCTSYHASLILVMSLSLPPSVSLGFVFVYVLVLSFTVFDCLRRIVRRTLYDLQCPYFSPEVIVKFTRRVRLMYGGQSKIRNLVASYQAPNFFFVCCLMLHGSLGKGSL